MLGWKKIIFFCGFELIYSEWVGVEYWLDLVYDKYVN